MYYCTGIFTADTGTISTTDVSYKITCNTVNCTGDISENPTLSCTGTWTDISYKITGNTVNRTFIIKNYPAGRSAIWYKITGYIA